MNRARQGVLGGQFRFGLEAWRDSSEAAFDRASKFAADSTLLASLWRLRALQSGVREARWMRNDPVFARVRADSAFEVELEWLEEIVRRQRRRVEREALRAP